MFDWLKKKQQATEDADTLTLDEIAQYKPLFRKKATLASGHCLANLFHGDYLMALAHLGDAIKGACVYRSLIIKEEQYANQEPLAGITEEDCKGECEDCVCEDNGKIEVQDFTNKPWIADFNGGDKDPDESN